MGQGVRTGAEALEIRWPGKASEGVNLSQGLSDRKELAI